MWTVDGVSKHATQEEMINNKQGKRSVLELTITKALKGKAVECYVKDTSLKEKLSLEVRGKYEFLSYAKYLI